MDDIWHWFGEDKSGNSAGFRGVNCYASTDLVTWELRGAALSRATAPELDTMDRSIERPKVSYNASTKRYVMWLHWEGRNYAEAKAGVFPPSTGRYVRFIATREINNKPYTSIAELDLTGTRQ